MAEKLYIHRFERDDMEGAYWTEYVVSYRPKLSSEWRHNEVENYSVIDWAETSDIERRYPDAVKVYV